MAQRPAVVDDLLTAYFDAIEQALGLAQGTLWSDEKGRAFAGYAPVLDTLGYSFAQSGNPVHLKNALIKSGTKQAWGVLETVLGAVLVRERDEKFVPNLPWKGVAPEIYDRHEQFLYLNQFVRGLPLELSSRGGLPSSRREQYKERVQAAVTVHPFVREKGFANEVFGSLVAAYHICVLSTFPTEIASLEELARTPFLWRACRSLLTKDTLIDGEALGYFLVSLWIDPMAGRSDVRVMDTGDGGARLVAEVDGGELSFLTTFPLRLLQHLGRGAEVRVSGEVRLTCFAQSTSFELQEGAALTCGRLKAEVRLVRVNDGASVDAEEIDQPPNIEILRVAPSANGEGRGAQSRFIVGGILANTHPWSVAATEKRPGGGEIWDKWVDLIYRCAARASAGRFPVLKADGEPADGDDSSGNWVRLQFSDEFARLISEI